MKIRPRLQPVYVIAMIAFLVGATIDAIEDGFISPVGSSAGDWIAFGAAIVVLVVAIAGAARDGG